VSKSFWAIKVILVMRRFYKNNKDLITAWHYTTTNALRLGQGKTLVAICSPKSYWTGLITVWVTICRNPRTVPQGTRLVYFTPSTSAIVPGLSFSRSHPDSRVFLQLPRFSSRLKIDLQLTYIWLQCCAPGSYMDGIVAARGTPYMFSTWFHRAAPFATQSPGRFQEFCFFLVSPRLVKEDKLQAFRGQESWKGLSDSFERLLREP